MEKLLKISNIDNVAVALADLKKDETITIAGKTITLLDDVAFGHKVALSDIQEGNDVLKYGHRIGYARTDLKCGNLVNEKNIKTALGDLNKYEYTPHFAEEKKLESLNFNGYIREDGEVGIRNELWISPLVSCVNCLAQELANRFSKTDLAKHTDGVFALSHAYGCSQLGCDHANTRKILADLCKHPNAGGILVLGLGCENNKMSDFKAELGEDLPRVRFLESQSVSDEIETGMTILKELAEKMKAEVRTPAPISKLKIGLKCGGSDAFSGITANVLIGKFADMAISRGASCVLCEVPEMFGAETLLMNRAKSKDVFEKIVEMINSFKQYFISNNMPIYENPSPGNKAGGISTLEEKSLGCVQKGGTSVVNDVLAYADRIKETGLSLLESPGNDPVAATALAASGCQMVLFSTGRGTPFSTAVPTVKISSNTALFEKKQNWIDFNAGSILTGTSLENLSQEFFDYLLDIANGKLTKAEKNGYKEISIFKTGVTL